MNKLWRVAGYEYTRHVLRRRFLFGLLSIPLMIGVLGLVIFLLIRSDTNPRPVGYVDKSGVLANPVPQPVPEAPDRPVDMVPYQTEEAAMAALQAGEIQAYFVVGDDYLTSRQVELVSLENPSASARDQFESFLRANLLRELPDAVANRLSEGDDLEVRTPDGSRTMKENAWFSIFVPFIAGFLFMISMFTTSGYLMQAVVEEKENRTMEVLITSVSPFQLIAGKVIGIVGVGLTQIVIWLLMIILAVLVGRNYFDWLNVISISPGYAAILVAAFLPAFVMIASLMVALGSTVTEAQEGQQFTGLFTLPVVIPYWFTYQLMSSPNSPLAIGLSMFPFTAPVTLSLRAGFTTIPAWQIVLNVAILVVFALVALSIAGRAFRLGMLRYGQRLTVREILG